MMMSLLSFSQTNLVKKVVIDKDTGAFISLNGVKDINKIIINSEECDEINDSLKSIIKNYDIAYYKLDSSLTYKKIEVLKKDSINKTYDDIMKEQDKLIHKKDIKISVLKAQRNILFPISIIFAILLLL
jgi:hypothetical protein